jgi:carboxyl-terminal processing protease
MAAVVLAAGVLAVSTVSASRQVSGVPLRPMLREAYDLVKKRYYDPSFRGLDWDARFQEFDGRLKTVTSVNAGLAAIAEFLDALKDSHTYFLPPTRPFDHDYGYRLQVIGEKTFIARVVEKSDAAAKLAPGDEVLSLNGFVPSRQTLPTVNYILGTLAPLETVDLAVRSPTGATRRVVVTAKITERPRRLAEGDAWAIYRSAEDPTRPTIHHSGSLGDVMVWRMPNFLVEDDGFVDGVWERARRHKALILDLRGNPGGYQTTLVRMLANSIDRDFKAFERAERKGRTPVMVKTRKDNVFKGELVVLIDSDSASSAELFARIVQLEKRGVVVGDRSAGAVMGSRFHEGAMRGMVYGFSITEIDAIMNDGKSLEGGAVIPDEVVLPTPADLKAGNDPAMSRAAARLGVTIDPAAAGKLFEKEKK